jgi:alkanesulfonate monooxygenase SsuD/methylene tetrahydromethanopterin reductase-like flavin-dependent oxidoreductase (luciferase family)
LHAHRRLESRSEQCPPLGMLEYAVVAEQARFDSIDASDHLHPWAEVAHACFIWTWLGAAAARTSRIRLGTGHTCPIRGYHPSTVAQASATLAAMARVARGIRSGRDSASARAGSPAGAVLKIRMRSTPTLLGKPGIR